MNIYKVTLSATFAGEVYVHGEDRQEAADLAFEAFGPVLSDAVIPKYCLAENGGSVTDYEVDPHPLAVDIEDVAFECEDDSEDDSADDDDHDEDNDDDSE
mgnify:FL=1